MYPNQQPQGFIYELTTYCCNKFYSKNIFFLNKKFRISLNFAIFPSDRLPSYHHISIKMCDKIVTPPFHFDHLPTQVPKSAHCAPDSESEKNI